MKATAKKSKYAGYKDVYNYAKLLEIEGDNILKNIAECITSLNRKLEANRMLERDIFAPKDMLDTVMLFLGEYVTITEE